MVDRHGHKYRARWQDADGRARTAVFILKADATSYQRKRKVEAEQIKHGLRPKSEAILTTTMKTPSVLDLVDALSNADITERYTGAACIRCGDGLLCARWPACGECGHRVLEVSSREAICSECVQSLAVQAWRAERVPSK